MNKTLFFILLSTLIVFNGNGQTYQWAKRIGGASGEVGQNIAVDASGNVYVTGYFSGTADFDPGPGTVNLSALGTTDIFFAKYDGSGNYIWAKRIGGTGSEAGQSIALDAAGNVCITGYFSGTTDFDPGPGTATLASSALSDNDVFFAKYDGSGNYIWAKRIGGLGIDLVYSIAVDAMGNTYLTGSHQVTTDFDPGPGTVNLTAAGAIDIFFAKYDGSGNYIWAKSMGNTTNDRGYSIAVDAGGNVYVTGYFSGTTDFDPGPGTANLSSIGGTIDVFFAKYDGGGNYIWAKNLGSTSNDIAFDIVCDAGGNVYITGFFIGTLDFDPGPGTANLTSVGNEDVFFSKYDGSGNYIWAKNIGGTGSDYGQSIALDVTGNVYITGFFNTTVDFDPGPGTVNLTSTGSEDIFFAKYDVNGNYLWAQKIGGTGNDTGTGIVASGGNVYISGYFSVTADFDPGPGTANLTSAGSNDVFFAKYSSCTLPSTPGTISGNTTLCSGSSITYSVTNDPSATSYSWTLPGGWSGSSTTNSINVTTNATSGNVMVSASNSCGTSAAQTLAITVNAVPPTPGVINGATSLCAGVSNYSVAIVAGATSYSWTLPGGWSGSSSSNSINATAGTSGNIMVSASNACGTSAAQTLSVTVNTVPVTPNAISGSTSLCAGTGASTYSVTSVAGATSYTWSLAGGWSGSSSSNIISAAPGSSGIFTVTASNACGMSPQQTLSVTVNPLPTISVNTSDSIICGPPFQMTATLTASGASTYTFDPGGVGSSVPVSPSVTTTYTVTGASVQGCNNSSAFTQSVSACIGIRDLIKEEVNLYPNPTSGKITISGISSNEKIELYNAFGQLIYRGKIENENFELDLSKESAGIYFIRINSKTKKIVKE